MEFECHATIETSLSKNSVNFIETIHEKQVEFRTIGSSGGLDKKHFKSEIESAEFQKGKNSSGLHPKRGILTSLGEKISTVNEALCDYSRSITDLPSALISEIFNCLDPKELGVVSCVSNSLYRIASEHHVWKEFYCDRWGQPVVPAPLGVEYSNKKLWKELFVEREYRSKTFLGRFSLDVLYGHKEAVRTVFVLASKKLIFTSGYDSIVRMWDMEDCLAISSSRPLGCTIRAVFADTKLLIAGGTEGFIHGWRAEEGLPTLFDLKGPPNQVTEFRLWEHGGPVTCLALDLTRIYSGSWDMTVCVWDRSNLKCVNILRHGDWVWCLAPHDTTLASVSGSDLYVWDIETGNRVAVFGDAHVGNTYALARSHTGKLIFTGGEDGSILMFEFYETHLRHVATWVPHSGPVYSLSFEFPWLVSASSDGRLSLIDVRKLLKTSRSSAMGHAKRINEQKSVEPPQRMLHGFANNLFSVDIGCDRIVCGGEEGVVRVWNFSQALEIEQRVQASRGIRLENRMQRRKHQSEMNGKGLCADQFSVAVKNPKNGDRGRGLIIKHGVCGKVKA